MHVEIVKNVLLQVESYHGDPIGHLVEVKSDCLHVDRSHTDKYKFKCSIALQEEGSHEAEHGQAAARWLALFRLRACAWLSAARQIVFAVSQAVALAVNTKCIVCMAMSL